MKNQISLIGMAAIAAFVIGGGVHQATAQQATKPTAAESHIFYSADSARWLQSGTEMIVTIQGHVRIGSRNGSPVALTTGSDYFAIVVPTEHASKGVTQTVVHIPMDLSTLRVSVTPSGTTFTDQQGDTLAIATQAGALREPEQ